MFIIKIICSPWFSPEKAKAHISSVYAVIPVRPLFATSSLVQTAGTRSDTIIGTSYVSAPRVWRELYSLIW